MHKPKKRNPQSPQKSADWLRYIDDCLPALVIPLGPRFQADLPEWKEAANERCVNGDLDSSKWFGTKIWSPDDDGKDSGAKVGKGRSDRCTCSSPGSSLCIKKHISEARAKLRTDLGPAFKIWKFDEMGEDVGKSWSSTQKKKFENIVDANPLSQNKSFLKPAELSFPSKTRKDIVSYYLNVHVPKRISMITQSGGKVLVSDDEEVEKAPKEKVSVKRSRVNSDNSTKLAKSHYLTGRR